MATNLPRGHHEPEQSGPNPGWPLWRFQRPRVGRARLLKRTGTRTFRSTRLAGVSVHTGPTLSTKCVDRTGGKTRSPQEQLFLGRPPGQGWNSRRCSATPRQPLQAALLRGPVGAGRVAHVSSRSLLPFTIAHPLVLLD